MDPVRELPYRPAAREQPGHMSAPDDAQQSAEKILLAPSGASTHVKEFRVQAGIMGKKDSHYDPAQRTCDTD